MMRFAIMVMAVLALAAPLVADLIEADDTKPARQEISVSRLCRYLDWNF